MKTLIKTDRKTLLTVEEYAILLLTNGYIEPEVLKLNTQKEIELILKEYSSFLFKRKVGRFRNEQASKYFVNSFLGNRKESKEGKSNFILTSKQIYFWGVLFAKIITKWDFISNKALFKFLKTTYSINKELIEDNYLNLHFSDELEKTLLNTFLETLAANVEEIEPESFMKEVISETKEAYNSMLRRDLIEDPIEIGLGTIIISVFGFVPVGFTKKTDKGEVVERRINALFWKYKQNKKDNITEYHFHFRLKKILSIFLEITKQIDKDNSDDK